MVNPPPAPGDPLGPGTALSHVQRTADWPLRSAPPPLSGGEVHLWRVAVPAADGIPPGWRELLTAEEQARVARKRIPLDARRTLASRASLRLLLGSYLGVPPAAVALVESATGKPQLAAAPPGGALEFNVSHSGDWVVLAFARGLPVGVDVEGNRELEFGELASHVFSPPERAAWDTLPADERRGAFFAAWTRKEAYLKALGVGLAKPLHSFAVALDAAPLSRLVWCADDASAPERWLIASVDLAPGYTCALAVGTGATALHTFTLEARPVPSGPPPL